jgi:hypothetical protein
MPLCIPTQHNNKKKKEKRDHVGTRKKETPLDIKDGKENLRKQIFLNCILAT